MPEIDEGHTMALHEMMGGIPNLYWNAVSTDKLRRELRYTPLPQVHDVGINGVESYRYFCYECISLRLDVNDVQESDILIGQHTDT
jgi:hypothetical protein